MFNWKNFGVNSDWPWLEEKTKSFFLYSQAQIQENYNKVKEVCSEWSLNSNIFYSVKANPNPYILRVLEQCGSHFDVSSLNELQMLLKLRIDSQRISVSGPAKSSFFLNAIFKAKVKTIHLDSIEEWEYLKNHDYNGSLSFRLSLDEATSQKVGLPDRNLQTILREISAHKNIRAIGFHTYIGRERFTPVHLQKFINSAEKLREKFSQLFINGCDLFFGAGLPATPLLKKELGNINSKSFRIHLECGRALVQSAGLYGAQVLSIKDDIVIVDGGYQHMATHMGSPRYGFENVFVRAFRQKNELAGFTKKYRVHGSLSIWRDVLIENVSLPDKLERGDWLLFTQAGAYGLTAGTNQFIGTEIAEEFLYEDEYKLVSPNTYMSYYDCL